MVDIDMDTSFQFKLTKKIFKRPSQDVCVYFWQCVWAWTCVLGLLTVAVSTILTPLVLYTGYTTESLFIALFLASGMLVWFVALTFSIMYLVVSGSYKAHEKFREHKPKRTKPSIVTEYFKAKKEKFCPRINFYSSKDQEE